jgi:uncharacterized membrane protein
MKEPAAGARDGSLDRLLAKLLRSGTWIASMAIASGLVWAGVSGARGSGNAAGLRLATAGIGLLILLPMVRVSVMLVVFLRGRDYRLAIAAALVLAITLVGILVGIRTGSGE